MSLRDRIIASDDISKEIVTVPQWKLDVEVRTMSAVKRSQMLAVSTLDDGNINLDKLYPMLIIATVYDPETGLPVFSNEDMEALQEKSASAIEFIAQKAMKMSGMIPNTVDVEGKDN